MLAKRKERAVDINLLEYTSCNAAKAPQISSFRRKRAFEEYRSALLYGDSAQNVRPSKGAHPL